ncbi:MAG: DUF1631 family protein [Hylemonella sp.]|uniref:DUF1631 family protein n=1 Tax=Hylemonella sp. TaxID=2066020 RepID=UPI0022BD11C4|nr:DUF1631 family protein [Hylemonella sp.]MCZ8253148.1 DUF1631 family protein [Hylemonella sp.]
MKKFLSRRLGVSDDPTAEKPSLHDCIEAVLEQSGPLMDDVIKGLDLALHQVGGKVSKVNQRALSQPIVEELRRQAEAVRATFGVQLRLAIYRSGSHASDPEALVRFDDIQLLDEGQLEANIEFALAQQEIQFATDEVISPLNALISSLMGWMSVQAHLNPLRPETFARALRETLLQHVPSEQARTALITPAAGILGNSLRALYKELADWLRSQGIEPVVPLLTASGADASGRPVESPVTRTMLTLDKLRKLLTTEIELGGGAHKGKDFLHTVPASMVAIEDLKMVEPMIKRLSERALKDAKVAAKGKSGNMNRELGQQLGEEVVRLMLENLGKDQRLLLPVRAQVKELEPLLLKLAQSDPRFFSDKRHPARQFLDRITHQSLGYKTENDERFQRFLKMVTSAVLELLGSDGHPESFARALTMLDAQWARVDLELKARQDDAARALMHAEQRNLLAQRLAADFQERMRDKKLPEFIQAFLSGPWPQVVAESQLRAHGADDADGYLALVDDLLWSAQAKLARRNRARLVQLVPNLLVKLRQGLQLIEYPPERIPRFLDDLIALHEKAFEPPKVKPPQAELAPMTPPAKPLQPGVVPEELGGPVEGLEVTELAGIPDELPEEFSQDPGEESTGYGVIEAGDADQIWMAGHEADEAGYLPEGDVMPSEGATGAPLSNAWNAADLAIGCWVELQLKGEWVRAQLTWASPHRTLFMFISGKGLAHSMSRRTMEQLRTRGLMRVVSERHMVDNALDAVAQAALLNERKPPKS